MTPACELPSLTGSYPVGRDVASAYRRDGHACLRGVCSAGEISAYRAPIVEAVRRLNPEKRPLAERDTYGKAFLQTMNLWAGDESCRRFTFASRFAAIAADLMGVDAVRLYHDQALFKEGGGGLTPWHQDQHYWPLATEHTITMWMPLVDITVEMGVMTFADGSHTEGYFGEVPVFDVDRNPLESFVRQRDFRLRCHGDMRAGDATFHSGWTLHMAPPNQTAATREVMTVIYFADGTIVGPADNANRVADLETWLPGLRPGEPAASPLNPVLYTRR